MIKTPLSNEAGFIFIIIALFGLILALLAIEKNTRKPEPSDTVKT